MITLKTITMFIDDESGKELEKDEIVEIFMKSKDFKNAIESFMEESLTYEELYELLPNEIQEDFSSCIDNFADWYVETGKEDFDIYQMYSEQTQRKIAERYIKGLAIEDIYELSNKINDWMEE